MKDVNYSKKELIEILKNCYRKYKSMVYFQSVLSFRKKQIAVFENDKTVFDKTFSDLATAIINRDLNYFEKLSKTIDIFVVPKKTKQADEKKDSITNKHIIESVDVIEVNFYICANIELFIFDVYLTLILGTQIEKATSIKKYCYANVFSKNIYDDSGDLNYKSLYIFNYYYHQYKSWKNDAINASEQYYKKHKDSSIISLDITGYYYFVEANIRNILNDNGIKIKKSYNISFLADAMQIQINAYSNILCKYRADITGPILPIGLSFSAILSNLYLNRFDSLLGENTIHYGRYVDDVVFVIEGVKYDSFEKYALDNADIFTQLPDGSFSLTQFPKLVVKKEKCRVLNNYSDGSSDIFKKMKSEDFSISEYNLFPNFNADIESLINEAYDNKEYIKFREIEDININPTKIGKLVSGIITARKGTAKPLEKETVELASNLLRTISSQDCVVLCSKWDKLVLLFAWLRNVQILKDFIYKLKEIVGLVRFEPDDMIYKKGKQKGLFRIIKKSLISLIENAVYSYKALNNCGRSQSIIKMYRHSSLMDYNSILYPLVNFANKLNDSDQLVNMNFKRYIDVIGFGLDDFKIKYSPFNISLCDYMWARQICSIVKLEKYSVESIFDDYYEKIGSIFGFDKEPIFFSNICFNSYSLTSVDLSKIQTKLSSDSNPKIAIASINVDNMDVVFHKKNVLNKNLLKQEQKKKVITLLNESYSKDFNKNTMAISKAAKKFFDEDNDDAEVSSDKLKLPVAFVVFPEVFLPFEWSHLFNRFSKETQSIITSGIRYVYYDKTAFNIVACEVPFIDKSYHKQSLVLLREKNDIPLYEKCIGSTSKVVVHEKNVHDYFFIKNENLSFTTLVCFEATDVIARSLFKNKVDYVFTVAYNKDVNYFNSIGMSTARDLFCFYIECNSSNYGSTSYAPYRSAFLPISVDKGNKKEHMQIIKTELSDIQSYKAEYIDSYNLTKSFDFYSYKKGSRRNPKYAKMKKPSAGTK